MTASTARPPNSVTSSDRQASADRTRSNLSRSMSGIVTRSASTPRARSSSVSRRTWRSAPPAENGLCTAATRTRGGVFKTGNPENAGGLAGSRDRHAPDHRIVLRAEEDRVQPRVVFGPLVQTHRGGKRREELDRQVPEARGVAEEL